MLYHFLFLFLITCQLTIAVHDSLNFVLPPLKRECFFEDFDTSSPTRTIEAFVQTGGNVHVFLSVHGPLTLDEIRKNSFEDPILREKVDSVKEVESETLTYVTNFKPNTQGTYAICLDNREARFLPKIVQLDVRLASKPAPVLLKLGGEQDSGSSEEDAVAHVKESISRIRKGMIKIQLQQQRDRHRLNLHSQMNKDSHSHVVAGSIIETAFFVAASLFQIFFVRRWFATKTMAIKPRV